MIPRPDASHNTELLTYLHKLIQNYRCTIVETKAALGGGKLRAIGGIFINAFSGALLTISHCVARPLAVFEHVSFFFTPIEEAFVIPTTCTCRGGNIVHRYRVRNFTTVILLAPVITSFHTFGQDHGFNFYYSRALTDPAGLSAVLLNTNGTHSGTA